MERPQSEESRVRDEMALTEHIYEPKYGGKDHSGYETMMKYEINDEREEAYCNGWNAALKHSPTVRAMHKSLVSIMSNLDNHAISASCALGNIRDITNEAIYVYESGIK